MSELVVATAARSELASIVLARENIDASLQPPNDVLWTDPLQPPTEKPIQIPTKAKLRRKVRLL